MIAQSNIAESLDPEWRPHAGPQEEFCGRGEFEVFFGGAKGPGKTDCLIMEATRDIENPRYHGLILRRTYPRLQEIIDRCWLWYPELGGQYRATEHRWYFPGGAKITLGHVQHEADKHNYHGKEFHFVGFDELTEFTETQYLFILANIRKAHRDLGLSIRSTSNPGGPGHVWVKERFVDICKPTKFVEYVGGDGVTRQMAVPKTYIDPDTGTSRCFVPATVYDNPSIMVNDPLYVRRLEALPEIEKLRLLHGVWDVFEGQVFVELSKRVHGCDQFDVPPDWETFGAFDWGYSRPWCYLVFSVDFDGCLYLVKEHYGMKGTNPNEGVRQTNTEICREILKVEDLLKVKMRYRVADPACWAPTKLKGSNKNFGPSFVEDASKEGLFFIKPDNSRIRGKQQVHQRLQLEEEIDQKTGEVISEYPRFQAFKTCKRWWAEMMSLYENVKDSEDVDTDQPDEGYDCTRYAMMSRPFIPKLKPKEMPGTFQAERKRYIRAKQYAIRHSVSLAAAYAAVR